MKYGKSRKSLGRHKELANDFAHLTVCYCGNCEDIVEYCENIVGNWRNRWNCECATVLQGIMSETHQRKIYVA